MQRRFCNAKFLLKWHDLITMRLIISSSNLLISKKLVYKLSRRTSSSLCTREATHNKKIAPASPDDYVETLGDEHHTAVHTSVDQTKEDNVTAVHADSVHGKENGKRKRKLPFYCCLYFLPGQVMG